MVTVNIFFIETTTILWLQLTYFLSTQLQLYGYFLSRQLQLYGYS